MENVAVTLLYLMIGLACSIVTSGLCLWMGYKMGYASGRSDEMIRLCRKRTAKIRKKFKEFMRASEEIKREADAVLAEDAAKKPN